MALVACKLCRKLFDSKEGKVCSECHNRLDEIYVDVRNYLRDHRKEEFNVEKVAEAVDADIRYIQELVDEGYLDRDAAGGKYDPSARSDRERLAKAFEQSVDQLKATVAALNKPAVTYGQEVYAKKR